MGRSNSNPRCRPRSIGLPWNTVDCCGLWAALQSRLSNLFAFGQTGRTMSDPPSPGSPPADEGPSDDRLDSWKEIAAYMKRDVTTVQRWEKREGMPVHRHVHDKVGSVYAFKSDLDAWARSRSLALGRRRRQGRAATGCRAPGKRTPDGRGRGPQPPVGPGHLSR